MKTKSLLFTLFTVTLFALGTLATLFFNTTPSTRDVIWLFYSALLLSCFGLIFFVLFLTNYFKNRATPPWQSTAGSFRYATLAAVLLTVMVALKSHQVLNLASGLVITVATVLLELVWRRKGSLKA